MSKSKEKRIFLKLQDYVPVRGILIKDKNIQKQKNIKKD